MSKAYTVTIDLPEDDAAFVDALLADGAYDTVSDWRRRRLRHCAMKIQPTT